MYGRDVAMRFLPLEEVKEPDLRLPRTLQLIEHGTLYRINRNTTRTERHYYPLAVH